MLADVPVCKIIMIMWSPINGKKNLNPLTSVWKAFSVLCFNTFGMIFGRSSVNLFNSRLLMRFGMAFSPFSRSISNFKFLLILIFCVLDFNYLLNAIISQRCLTSTLWSCWWRCCLAICNFEKCFSTLVRARFGVITIKWDWLTHLWWKCYYKS